MNNDIQKEDRFLKNGLGFLSYLSTDFFFLDHFFLILHDIKFYTLKCDFVKLSHSYCIDHFLLSDQHHIHSFIEITTFLLTPLRFGEQTRLSFFFCVNPSVYKTVHRPSILLGFGGCKGEASRLSSLLGGVEPQLTLQPAEQEILSALHYRETSRLDRGGDVNHSSLLNYPKAGQQ